MNKIYKVMYSKVKQCCVVVSEIAKSHGHNGESSGVKKHAALTAAVLIALGSLSFTTAFVPMTAEAADKTRTDGSNFVGVERTNGLLDESKYENSGGKGANGADSITLGLRAKAGEGTITIGDRNAGASLGSVYVGQGDIAKPKIDIGGWATSIGYNSDATGYGSIALGSNAVAKNSYAKDSKGESLHYSDPYTENGEQKVRLVAKPDIQRASVAIGYGASADNGNIAIGSYSDASTDLRTAKTADGKEIKSYLTDKKADSYVSVGDGIKDSETQYRRISNVADGASASDVATVGQLQALAAKSGTYKAGFGIKITPDTTTKENTISLNRNLGTNLDKTGHVHLDVSDTGLVLGTVVDGAQGTDTDLHYGATGDYAVTVGGGVNTASGNASVVLGGSLNKASNEATVASGGSSNVASGSMAAVYGGFDNEASEAYATILGGAQNKASNTWTAVGGGALNEASGKHASVWGGYKNTATDDYAAVYGGLGNSAYGPYSAILGGGSNKAGGAAVVSGGASNEAAGVESAVLGGVGNIVTGANATAVGGAKGSVNGVGSVGILGGSTGINAPFTLAAGYQSTVTDTGVTSTPITEEEAEKFQEEGTHPGLLVGSNDPDNLSFKILDHFATAVGYQATADEAQTVAFGHDKGDTYYGTTTYTWKQKATVKDGHYYDEYNQEISKESYESLKNADGTWNDYSQPIATVEEKKYDSAYYNRLVKAADGIEDHDAVVMEQLKNASDVGSHIKVYKTDTNGNVQFDENNKPIEDTSNAAKTTRDAAQKASEDAWGEAIGTGKVEANNFQLVTGDTVYNAIQNQAEWKLTTNGESADKAAAIKPGTTVNFSAEKNGKDHSNVTISHNGSNVTIGLDKDIVLGDTSHSRGGSLNVYTDSSDGNNLSNHVSINGSTISVNYPKSNGDKKTPTDTRGVILGVGEEGSKPDGYIAFNNVEGGYTYLHASTDASDDKKGRLEYVGSDGNKKYIANLDDVSTAVNNAKTKYYSVTKGFKLGDYRTNENNDGATDDALAGMAAGYETGTTGIASTVAGSYSGVIGSGLQGAAAVSVGTVNVNNNTGTSKAFSGVANSIVGQANMTTDSNAAIIVGAGNSVTNSYRDLDKDALSNITSAVAKKDANALKKALQDAVPKSGGQVMVMGGGNNVESAYMSQVVGVGNTVKGNQVKNDKNEWVADTSKTAIKDYDPEKSSQYNYVDGFNNEVINGKHDYIIGANNKLSGDSYDDDQANPIKRSNKSNIVIGDNHTLTRKQNTVIIGSSDTENTQTKANDAVIIGHNANATSNTGADNAVAIGRKATATGGNAVTIGVNTSAGENSITIGSESHADSGSNIAIGRSAQVYGYEITNAVALGQEANAKVADGVAIGSGSEATVTGKSTEGYDPTTGQTSTDPTGTWQATKAAVSIGKADGTVTRQINGVAAGTNDTDAVNVAQIKKLEGMKANVDASNIGKNLKGADGKTAAADAEKTANEKAWGAALGTGDIATPKDMLVTDKAIHDELRPATDGTYVKGSQTTAENLSKLDAQVKTNADDISTNTTNITKNAGDITKLTNLSNITNEGQKVIKNLSKDAVKVTAGDRVTVTSTENKEAGTITYKVSANNDGTVAAGDQNLVSGDTVNTAITNAINNAGTATDTKLAGKANINASNIGKNLKGADGKAASTEEITANENAWGTAIGTGKVADPTQSTTNDPTQNGSQQLITGGEVYKALHGGLDDVVFGHDGKDGQPGKDGSIGLVGQTGKKGEDGKNAYATTIIKTEKGVDGVDGKNGEDGITRIVYNDTDNPANKHTVATLDDGMKYAGDTGTVANVKLDHQLKISGTTFDEKNKDKQYKPDDWTSNNIAVISSAADEKTGDATMYLKLNKDLNLTDKGSVRFGDKDSNTTLDASGLTIKSTVTKEGKTEVVNGPSITKDGIDGGSKAITNIGSGIEKDKDGNYTDKSKSSAANISDVQTIVNDAKKDLTDGKNGLNSKANVDASNIGENLKDADGKTASADAIKTNKDAWALAIGTNKVTEGNKQLVTSDAVAKELAKKADKTYVDEKLDTKANKSDVYTKDETYSRTEVDSKVTDITKGIDGKAGKDLENISNKGKTVIHNIAKDAVAVVNGKNTTVTKVDGTDTTPTTYAVNVEGTGRVAAGDTGLISGDTLYKEVHIDKDGAYIKGSQSVGQNLSALDSGLKTTSDLIHTNTAGDTIQIGGSSTATKIDVNGKDGKGRVITGVVSDANDPTSAANVGYVNGVTAANTQQIYRDMNNAYGRLNNNINKAAAGSNALAALHPLDYDPDDKADFAVGYGHYRNANAAAVGAFYHPNENTMVNVGVSLGNGDPGFNAGVSFKVGRGGAGREAMSKTEMAKVINSQSKEIDALKKDNADKDKRIDALEQKMAEILAKLDKNGK